jgi:hypothetical protein
MEGRGPKAYSLISDRLPGRTWDRYQYFYRGGVHQCSTYHRYQLVQHFTDRWVSLLLSGQLKTLRSIGDGKCSPSTPRPFCDGKLRDSSPTAFSTSIACKFSSIHDPSTADMASAAARFAVPVRQVVSCPRATVIRQCMQRPQVCRWRGNAMRRAFSVKPACECLSICARSANRGC